MENRRIIVAAVIPTVLLGFVVVKMNQIENKLEQLEMTIRSSESSIRTSADNSINQIRDALMPKNQVLTSQQVEYGKLDTKTMKVPVMVSIVPRQYEKNTLIELKINDERIVMTDTGTSFTGTINRSIFEELHIETILTKGTIREVVYLEDAVDLWQKYTLQVSGFYDGGLNYTNGSFAINYAGNVKLNFSGQYAKVKKVDVYSELAGQKKLIKSYNQIKGNDFNERIDFKVAVKPGQMHLLYADIEDSIGLHYIYPLSSKEGINGKEELIFDSKVMPGVVAEIRDSNGALIYKPETIQ